MRPFLHCYELHPGVSNCFDTLIRLILRENGSFDAANFRRANRVEPGTNPSQAGTSNYVQAAGPRREAFDMTTQSTRAQALVRGLAAATLLTVLAACATKPEIRTQTAPALDILKYQSFGFVERPDTDKAGYTTLTTRYLKDAVTREMLARGYTQSAQPDLLVNFTAGSKDRVEGSPWPDVGVGWGRWSHGWGWGGTFGGRDIRTVTVGSLTVDVVDQQHKELIWSGTAKGNVTSKDENDPQPAFDKAVAAIFAKYPKQPLVASAGTK